MQLQRNLYQQLIQHRRVATINTFVSHLITRETTSCCQRSWVSKSLIYKRIVLLQLLEKETHQHLGSSTLAFVLVMRRSINNYSWQGWVARVLQYRISRAVEALHQMTLCWLLWHMTNADLWFLHIMTH